MRLGNAGDRGRRAASPGDLTGKLQREGQRQKDLQLQIEAEREAKDAAELQRRLAERSHQGNMVMFSYEGARTEIPRELAAYIETLKQQEYMRGVEDCATLAADEWNARETEFEAELEQATKEAAAQAVQEYKAQHSAPVMAPANGRRVKESV